MSQIPFGYCQCGCGEKTKICQLTDKRHNHIKGQPFQYLNGHRAPKNVDLNEIFWSWVDTRDDPITGCWNWKRATRNGYGEFTLNYKVLYAHRTAYQLVFGEIPKGMFVCHRCDNPRCCNPKHLFLGTHTDNMRDATRKGHNGAHTHPETRQGERHPMHKLTREQVVEIRNSKKLSHKELAKMFKVNRVTISNIISRRTWKSVP